MTEGSLLPAVDVLLSEAIRDEPNVDKRRKLKEARTLVRDVRWGTDAAPTTPTDAPTPEDQFLALLVAALDAARDLGLDWRWVERALVNTWGSRLGVHRWAPRVGDLVGNDALTAVLADPAAHRERHP